MYIHRENWLNFFFSWKNYGTSMITEVDNYNIDTFFRFLYSKVTDNATEIQLTHYLIQCSLRLKIQILLNSFMSAIGSRVIWASRRIAHHYSWKPSKWGKSIGYFNVRESGLHIFVTCRGARSARADARLCTSSGINLIVPLSFHLGHYSATSPSLTSS